MTKPQRATLNALIALWVALIVWDVFLATDGETGTTISAVTKSISNVVAISYVFGVLAGHLFWNRKGQATEKDRKWYWYKFAGAVLIAGMLVVWQMLSSDAVITCMANNHIIPFAFVGIPCGHLLWPQFMGDAGA